jgi:hypothetical protein
VAPPPQVEKPVEAKPGEVHRVAILVPLSGPNAPVGVSLANAATLALVDTNKQGVRRLPMAPSSSSGRSSPPTPLR